MSRWTTFKHWLDGLWNDHEHRLIEQFYGGLRASYHEMGPPQTPPAETAAREIERLLEARPRTWQSAYEMERLLVSLFSTEHLKTALATRLLECQGKLRDEEVVGYREMIGAAGSDEERRAILGRILDDLQWGYTVREQTRAYARVVRSRTSILFFVSILPFLSGLAWVRSSATGSPYVAYLLLALSTGLWGASFSMLVGLRRRLEAMTLEEGKVHRRWSFLFSRAVIGVGAGLVLYLFLEAGLLSGPLFPDMNRPQLSPERVTELVAGVLAPPEATAFLEEDSVRQALGVLALAPSTQPDSARAGGAGSTPPSDADMASAIAVLRSRLTTVTDSAAVAALDRQLVLEATTRHPIPRAELALLIVWALVAGFSESLVPSLLANVEAQAQIGSDTT